MIAENYSLTGKQILHFETFGFLVRRNVFSAEEVAKINGEFDRRRASILAEIDPEEKRTFTQWPTRNPENPFTASLLDDPRIYVPSEQLVGEDSIPVQSHCNSYGKSSGWHVDTFDRRLCVIKNLLYLQPTTADRGALRVIPGSHRSPLSEDLRNMDLYGFHDDTSPFLNASGMRGEDIPCYIFESEPGDVITFNELTWHAAFGGYKDRRSLSYNFFTNPKADDEIESMKKIVEHTPANTQGLGTVGLEYHPNWLENADNNPRRARWINWLEKWGFVDAFNN